MASPSTHVQLLLLSPSEQRLYIVSTFALIQAWKIYQLLFGLPSTQQFLALDAAFILLVPLLRVSRFRYTISTRIALVAGFGLTDWLVCGGWRTVSSLDFFLSSTSV